MTSIRSLVDCPICGGMEPVHVEAPEFFGGHDTAVVRHRVEGQDYVYAELWDARREAQWAPVFLERATIALARAHALAG